MYVTSFQLNFTHSVLLRDKIKYSNLINEDFILVSETEVTCSVVLSNVLTPQSSVYIPGLTLYTLKKKNLLCAS